MTEQHDQRVERALTDVRVEVAAGFAAINARLDASKDHEPRLRKLEQRLQNQLTRDDVQGMLEQAINSARRPAWRDVGMLVAAIATSTMLVIAVVEFASRVSV